MYEALTQARRRPGPSGEAEAAHRLEAQVTAFALVKLAFGVVLFCSPRLVARVLFGTSDPNVDSRGLGRGMGIRDVATAIGILTAATPEGRTLWLRLGALGDGGDAFAAAADASGIPPAKRWIGLLSALGMTATGLALARCNQGDNVP